MFQSWCVRRGSLLQDCLPVKFQVVKFKDPKFKHEIFVRIDIKHSYFPHYFITFCHQFFLYLKLYLNCLFAKL